MFKFLKEKLKGAVNKLSKDIDEQAEEIEEKPEELEEAPKPETEESLAKDVEKGAEKAGIKKDKKEEKPEDKKEKAEEKKEEPKKAEEKTEKKEEKPEHEPGPKEETEEKKPEPKPEEKKEVVKEKKAKQKAGPSRKEEKKEVKKEKRPEEASDLTDTEKKLAADFEKEEKEEKEKPKGKEEDKESKKGFFGKIKDRFTKKEERPEEEQILDIPEEKKEEEFKPEDIALPEEVKEAEKEEELPEAPAPEERPEKPEEKPEKPEEKPKEKLEEKAIAKEEVPGPEKREKSPKEKDEPSETPEALPEEKPKKGIFGRITETITKKKLSESKFEDLFWDMEVALLENNIAVEVIEKIKNDLKIRLVNQKLTRGKIEEEIMTALASSIAQLFDVETFDLIEKAKAKKPYVIAFVGVNGSGKTTTIAKMVRLLQENNLRPVIAASDTFRAAAIQQLEEHANKLNVKVIKHDYGSDPAAVAYDAIEHARAKDLDVVLIDTAGRLHSNANLMDEMKKIIRVAKPDMKLFIGESITGNDCVEQAKQFNEAVGIDAIILSKADVDEKGGAAISVSYVTGKPILYIGTGQEYKDLKKFDKSLVLETLGM